jgi:hypothetical protein
MIRVQLCHGRDGIELMANIIFAIRSMNYIHRGFWLKISKCENSLR